MVKPKYDLRKKYSNLQICYAELYCSILWLQLPPKMLSFDNGVFMMVCESTIGGVQCLKKYLFPRASAGVQICVSLWRDSKEI